MAHDAHDRAQRSEDTAPALGERRRAPRDGGVTMQRPSRPNIHGTGRSAHVR
jgi:hypothetical protein